VQKRGGQCDQQLSAGSWGNIPKKRSKEMKPKWDAAPELSAADAI
jgi:hypothetical protein